MKRSRSLMIALVVTLGAGVLACDADGVTSQRRVSEAVQLAQSGAHLDALRRLDEALSLDPSNAQAHYFMGLIRLQQYGNPGQAVESLERAAALMPADEDVQYQLGVAWERLGNSEQAQAQFEKTLALNSGNAAAQYRIGTMMEARGDIQAAVDRYTAAIYADPRFGNPYNALGNLYERFGFLDEAAAVFANGVENSHRPDAESVSAKASNLADLGRVLIALGQLDDAIAALEAAVELSRTSAARSMNLGVAYARRFEATGRESDRASAIATLTTARSLCNIREEMARCESIAATLLELREQEGTR